MYRSFIAASASACLLLAAAGAGAQTPVSESVAKCQKEMTKQADKLQKMTKKRINSAYGALADELIGQEATEVSDKVATKAVKALEVLDKASLADNPEVQKLGAKVMKRCDPALNVHTLADIQQTLGIEQLAGQCAPLGVPEVSSVDDWVECIARKEVAAAESAHVAQTPTAGKTSKKLEQKLTSSPPPKLSPASITKAIAAADQITKAGAPPAASSPFAQYFKLVFVTGRGIGAANFGGLAGGDQFCQESAEAAGLPGTYKAWLSDDVTSAAARLTHATVPYVMVNGTKIADDWADLTDGTIDAPFAVDEFGRDVVTPEVWTGTTSAGASIVGATCNGWTSDSGAMTGFVGVGSNTNASWTSAYVIFCAGAPGDRLYCLQQ